MAQTGEVIISGFALSHLLGVVAQSRGDAEGLLLGKLTKIPYKERESSATLWDTSFVVQGSLLCGSVCSFYSPAGVVDLEQLRRWLGDRELIGWYRFRRGAPLIPSAREIAVHHSLAAQLNCKGLVFALFTQMATPPTFHLHTFDYKFIQFVEATPLPLVINIANMKQSSEEEYDSFLPLSTLKPTVPALTGRPLSDTAVAEMGQFDQLLLSLQSPALARSQQVTQLEQLVEQALKSLLVLAEQL